MGRILKAKYAMRYNSNAPPWPVYDLLFDPLPILALRNCSEIPPSRGTHTTLCWLGTKHEGSGERRRFALAVRTTCELLAPWKAFRGSNINKVKASCAKRVPSIIRSLSVYLRRRGVRHADDVVPNDPHYSEIVIRLAKAVANVSRFKYKSISSPMFGSKVLHFLMPELFPVWDWTFIKKRCLKCETEYRESVPMGISERLNADKPALEYARYLHLMLSDRATTPSSEFDKIRKLVIGRALEGDNQSEIEVVLEHHYGALTPTLFEICLLGKWVKTKATNHPPE